MTEMWAGLGSDQESELDLSDRDLGDGLAGWISRQLIDCLDTSVDIDSLTLDVALRKSEANIDHVRLFAELATGELPPIVVHGPSGALSMVRTGFAQRRFVEKHLLRPGSSPRKRPFRRTTRATGEIFLN